MSLSEQLKFLAGKYREAWPVMREYGASHWQLNKVVRWTMDTYRNPDPVGAVIEYAEQLNKQKVLNKDLILAVLCAAVEVKYRMESSL